MDSMQLLIADLDHLRRSLLQSEEMGEKRFEFFMALVTAAVAGLIALATADKHPLPWLPVVAIGSLAGIVAFGTLTYLRMLHRNQVTDRLKRTIDEIVKLPMTTRWKEGDRFNVDVEDGEIKIDSVQA